MKEVYEPAKNEMIKTIARILLQNRNTLTQLSLVRLTDVLDEGTIILNQMAFSNIKRLEYISLRYNPIWFESEDYIDKICQFISN